MPMPHVGIVGMRMRHGRMVMHMAVFCFRRPSIFVSMLMFSFMIMFMLVFNRLMDVGMDVLLSQVKPNAKGHAYACGKQP